MSLIIPANTLASGGYEVANSCRFNSGDSAVLKRTHGTPTSAKKFVWSAWIKRSKLGADQYFVQNYTDGSNSSMAYFRSGDDIRIFDRHGTGDGTDTVWISDGLFRDTSAWMHFLLKVDTTQSTDSDRFQVYINGSLATGNGITYPALNADMNWTAASASNRHSIAATSDGYNYVGGYLCEVVLVDGTSPAHTDFGEFDSDSPTIWKPKDVSGLTFGTNGYYLDFADSGDLGDDESGNGNDFAETNLAATDQSTDTCTNNFATLNPLNNYWSAATFSEGNSVYTSNNTGAYYGVSTSTIGVSSGKWYFEAKNSTDSSGQGILGITSRNQTGRSTWLGSTTQAYGYYATGGVIRSNSADTSYGAAYTVNDIIGIYMDLDNNKMYVSDNGVLQNSGTGHTITAAASTDSGFYHFAVGDNSDNTQVWQCNFGGTSGFTVSSGNTDVNGYGNFEYDPSAGTFDGVSKDFLALCTKNLSEFG